MVTYAICDASFSLGLSLLLKWIGRVTIFVLGTILNLSILILLQFWMPKPTEAYVFFVIAALWGASDAVWQTQINGKYSSDGFVLFLVSKCAKYLLIQSKMDGFGEHF